MLSGSVLRALIRRPRLWIEAIRTWLAFTPSRWWAIPPHLPVPRRSYWKWRMTTAYGSPDAEPHPEEVIEFLQWRKDSRGQRR